MQQAKEGNLQDSCHSDRMLDGLQLRFALVGGVFEVQAFEIYINLMTKKKQRFAGFSTQ